MMKCLRIALILLSLAGCARIFDEARPGELTGQVLVVWIGPGSDTSGDGRFIFVPPRDPSQRLTFQRPSGAQVASSITPEAIYTDGGSIPRVVQPFKGFNPWAYAPAYMIHDWLFVARRCLNDGKATEAEKAIADMDFRDSARILAEVMKTMERQEMIRSDDFAPSAITAAVASPLARARWEAEGECKAHDRLSPEDAELVEAVLRAPDQEAVGLFGDDLVETRATIVTTITVRSGAGRN
ncbi:DUF1353 domain-containing protein [Roseovarius sp. D22-M7]|uniref:DUF1353 domain-containing protein n=1 Tax=Roseovarius sp. D22-M7 TaxID=3127116 RepID=UPI0030105287